MSTAHRPQLDGAPVLRLACAALEIEAQAILGLRQQLDENFVNAVSLILNCTGRVVVTGMGKSGHIGLKIAATLASTGTPAFFMHPAEASHGDLGMVTQDDVVLALSHSGESDELVSIVPVIKRIGIPLIAITGRPDSTLARQASLTLSCSITQEACPLNLAPTASTTAQLALGDALAVALLDARGFRAEDFARSHPGGALGRRLLVHVQDLMRTGDKLPVVAPDAVLTDMLRTMSSKGMGFVAIVDGETLAGIFTDGDLRRLIEREADLRSLRAREVMHGDPKVIGPDALAAEAASMMERHRVTSMLVVDARRHLIGALNSNDLMLAKVI